MNNKGIKMRKKNLKMFISLFALLTIVVTNNAFSQEDDTIKVKNIITKFKNYRFGTINIYKLGTPEVLNDFKLLASAAKGAAEVLDTAGVSDDIKKTVAEEVTVGNDDPAEIIKAVRRKHGQTLPMEKVEALIKLNQKTDGGLSIANAYILTSRQDMKRSGPEYTNIIGLIITTTDDGLEKDLADVAGNQIFLKHEMEARTIPGSNGSKRENLLNKVIDQFYQGNVENKTQDAQLNVAFAPKKVGVVKPFIPKDSLATKYIQQFVKITEGQVTFKEKTHEIILSPDLISWRRYDQQYRKDKSGRMVLDTNYNKENFIYHIDPIDSTRKLAGFRDPADVKYLMDTTKIPNDSLPKMGLELKYGIDDINYYSLWSERLTASVILENAKIGAILPMSLLGNNKTDWYGNTRIFTTAGFGVAGSFDMPVALIKNSGIFNISFGYVFGDAKPAEYNKRSEEFLDPLTSNGKDPYTDYLVRYNMKLHYTLGMSIDTDWLLRFGIGAAGYNVETWNYQLVQDSAKLNYKKMDNTFVGGISTSLELMRINISTPFGAGIQYFASGLGAKLWWHIPLPIFDDESLAFRFDAKYYSPIFKKTLDPWETLEGDKVFSLMGRLIIRL
jgi:hypothetical protein